MAPRKFVKRRPRFSKAKAKPRAKRASSSLVKTIKRVISRQAENKVWADYGVNQSITTASGSIPTFKNLVPVLSAGTGNSSIIGNEMRVRSGYIRGHVNLLPYNATTNNQPLPCYVKMWVCSSRVVNTNLLSGTSIASDFYEAGASVAGPQGNMLDIDFSPNKAQWIIHSTKIVKLGGSYNITATVNNASYFDSSPMSVPFQFNFGKKLTGSVKYSDTSNVSSNKNLFIVFQCVAATGQDSSSQIMSEFHYTTRVEYEDI